MKNQKKTNRDLDFLFEIGCLRFMQRSWKRFLGPNFSSISEHIYRVMWIALILAKMEKAKNTEKIMKMALVHDITESRTGEMDYLSRNYAERKEEEAIGDMLAETSLEKEFLEIWEEYDRRECLEAKIVKDADDLDIDFELMEHQDHSIFPVKKKMRSGIIPKKLFTQSAKKLWREIYQTDVHHWHTSANNRVNTGDWRSFKNKK